MEVQHSSQGALSIRQPPQCCDRLHRWGSPPLKDALLRSASFARFLRMSFSTRVSTVTRQSTPRTALTPRALPLRPPHALRWISSSRSSLPLSAAFAAAFPSKALRAQTPPGTKPAAQADKETTGPPAFLPLKDLTPFTHPSLFHTPRWRFEIPEQVDGVPYTHYDYEMHVVSRSGFLRRRSQADLALPMQRYGEKILEMALLGLIWKTYPRLSAGGATVRLCRLPPAFFAELTRLDITGPSQRCSRAEHTL